ncbi:LysR family transcriptional regulator [Halioxenophilus sp. WMMB6]|uniref:LysR family transcriptional regulator n=1 Tax=Halioxenophilus sp. WMMB6 TaxID=3073815 RepID=UPI00295F33B2|nr:LysR family transcriptional regulator [Halioxenophilus sp. WMMB6]
MDVDLKRLKHLVTVAKLGSISHAAEELHITQPALSRSIASLEAQFGVRLFERGRNGVTLTPLGSMAVAEAEAVLKRAGRFSHNLGLYSQGLAGNLAFGLGPLLASLLLPELSIQFLNSHPQLKLSASVKSATALLQALQADEVEFFYCGEQQLQLNEDQSVSTVGSLSLARVVKADHPLLQGGNFETHLLNQYPILSGVELSRFFSRYPNGMFVCDNYDILRNTVRHTNAIWITSPQLVAAELSHGELVALPGTTAPEQVNILRITRQGYQLSPAAKLVTEFIDHYFQAQPR